MDFKQICKEVAIDTGMCLLFALAVGTLISFIV